MRTNFLIVAVWATILHQTVGQHALFVKNQAGPYRVRQGTLREYLPPSNTQKPRPFETPSPSTGPPFGGGYPPNGITPQPPFPTFTNPATGGITAEGGGYPSPNPPQGGGYPTSPQPQPPLTEGTGYPSVTPKPGFPSQPPTGYPTQPPTGHPTQPPTHKPTGYPTQPPTGYPTQPPTQKPGLPSQPPTGYPTQPPTGYPTHKPGFPSQPPTGYPTQPPTEHPTPKPGFPGQPPTGYPTQPPTQTPPRGGFPTGPPTTGQPGPYYTSPVITSTESAGTDDNNVVPSERPEPTDETSVTAKPPQPPTDEDLKHPPHIHAIDVECAKDMMTISIEFNREYNGVIYSKGHYSSPECRYVNENSEQTKYKFTVSLNSCGTEFVNAFDTQGQSYLENVLVVQNEAGIQEVWDTVRSVRCLWEGSLKDSLSVALSVGMLSQEIVTFSGDTAMARLDIQLGRGPFAPPASGLVKIGETMTLVISVSGDPGFDIQVRDCRASDASSGGRVYPLTDDNGCVLKPKLFGAFQKTRSTQDTGASIIAYAFFNAFKFPDSMDLMIQCNIELCKTDCQTCPDGGQPIEPGRRRRDVRRGNGTEESAEGGVTVGRAFRVIMPEDLGDNMALVLTQRPQDGVCMTTQNFVLSSAVLISLLTVSCFMSAALWLKNQRLTYKM